MKWVVIIISFLSIIVAIYPIVFEDALKKRNKNEPRGKVFKIKFSKVTPSRLGFILSIISLNILNGLISYKSIDDSDRKQEAIEIEKENTFIHMQNEVQDNLIKLIYVFSKERVTQSIDSNIFPAAKLSDLYIKKYGTISKQKIVIGWLTQTSDAIIGVNISVDHFLSSPPRNPRDKRMSIELFQLSVEAAKKFLYPIYNRVYKLNSYKEYESIDFEDSIPPINLDTLNYYIFLNVIKRPDADTIPPKYY